MVKSMSNRKWSKQKIIDEIKRLYQAGEPLNDSYVNVHHKALYGSAISERYFGSWRNAITAAGFDYDKIIRYEFWSKQKIIDRILELHKIGEDLSVSNVRKNHNLLLAAACKKNYFGSWKNAIAAAGLEYDKINLYVDREEWSKQKIISRILELHKDGIDLSSRNMQKNYGSVFSAAFKYFGSWKNVITAAGLDYDKIAKLEFWSKQKIIEGIRELYKAGEPLNDSYVNKYHNPLRAAAVEKRYFGSWRNAVVATGLDYDEIRLDSDKEVWSKQKIIDRIIELNQNGENLNSHHMKSNHSTLYWAACRAKYFGSWENAIIAAGLDYEKIRKDADLEQWDKQKIIDRILDMYTEGEDLSAGYISMQHTALYSAACVNKYFGSWKNAIIGAGLDYEKIRLDIKTEFYKGRLFEKYLKEIFKACGKKVHVQKRFKFEEEACIPDFVDKDTGDWIDAKLKSWTGGIEESARKYLKYVDRVIIYYLIGEPRRWYKDKVVFKCVKDFYPQLKELGRDDIVQELSLLERGVIPSKYQTDLDKYLKMEESEEHIASIED